MSENTLTCIVITAAIFGCTTCSVSDNRKDNEKLRLEYEHTIKLLKTQLKQTAPKP